MAFGSSMPEHAVGIIGVFISQVFHLQEIVISQHHNIINEL